MALLREVGQRIRFVHLFLSRAGQLIFICRKRRDLHPHVRQARDRPELNASRQRPLREAFVYLLG